jgi:hypothetical protein
MVANVSVQTTENGPIHRKTLARKTLARKTLARKTLVRKTHPNESRI